MEVVSANLWLTWWSMLSGLFNCNKKLQRINKQIPGAKLPREKCLFLRLCVVEAWCLQRSFNNQPVTNNIWRWNDDSDVASVREGVCTASVLRAQLKLHFTQHQFVQGLLATIFTSCSQCYSIQMYSIQIKIVDTLFWRQHGCPILLLSKLKGLTDFPRATNAWGDSVCLRADPALAFWLRSNSRFGTRARLCSNPCKAFREATKAHVSSCISRWLWTALHVDATHQRPSNQIGVHHPMRRN